MCRLKVVSLFIALMVGHQSTLVAFNVLETRTQLEQWIETKRIQSRENADWTQERAILSDTVQLLESERLRLEEAISALGEDESATEGERIRLTSEREALNAATAAVEARIAPFEARLRNFTNRFPAPLLEQVRPLLRRIPEDPANTRLSIGERVQNIVGILGEADKFNSNITLIREIRELDGARATEVRTLYFGLAAAYFIDGTGEMAGLGQPTENGWVWTARSEATRAIRNLIDTYEGAGEVRFIEIPASIQ